MTLRQFLTVTAEIGDQDVRPALAHALKKEVPKSRRSYARFYRQVVEELTASGALARVEHVPPTGVRRVLAAVGYCPSKTYCMVDRNRSGSAAKSLNWLGTT
jgi:hypothetical protein